MPKILDMERGGHPLLPLPNLHQLTAPLGAPTPLGHGRYIKSATYFQKKFRQASNVTLVTSETCVKTRNKHTLKVTFFCT
jgi:hypothetical protein